MPPLWSILIPTQVHRQWKLARLLEVLLPQAERSPVDTEIVVLRNPGGPLPQLRQLLLDSARGTWVSFVDDDDMVAEYYCEEIGRAFLQYPHTDYIGFKIKRAWDSIVGIPGGISTISLRHPGWSLDYSDYTLLNPVRTTIARTGTFLGWGSNYGEDRMFRDQIIGHLHLSREVFIDKVMYFYCWDINDSQHTAWCAHQSPAQCFENGHVFPYWRRTDYLPPPALAVRSPVFRWHERSML